MSVDEKPETPVFPQMLGDEMRLRIEVEERAKTRDHRGESRRERQRDASDERGTVATGVTH